jgi:accessory gene regulator protein AgrB
VVPLVLVYLFSPYEWNNLYWLFLTFLFALKIIFYKEAPYKKELSAIMREKLTKELSRPPSKTEVVNRIEEMITARDVVIVSVGVLVIFVSLFFGKL